MLNPSMLFVIMCNMGFCTSSCRHVELISRLWHLHTWASQVWTWCSGVTLAQAPWGVLAATHPLCPLMIVAVACMQAYFNSPRARWTLRLLSNIVFVILFMQAGLGSDGHNHLLAS